MPGYSIYEIQKAIDAILSADAGLLILLGTGDADSIYDNPKQAENAIFPYIVYTSNTSVPFDSKTFNGSNNTFTISVYSRTGDKEETADILERIHTILHNTSLTVSNNTFVLCRWDGLSLIEQDDNIELLTYIGVIRFRVLTTE